MAVEDQTAETPEEDTEELELELEGGEEAAEQDQDEGSEDDQDQDQDGAADEDEVEITFGDEAAPASRGDNSELVKKLRAEIRERDRKLAAVQAVQQPQKIEVGEKPTYEGCDYDDAKFEQELDAWKDRKAKAEASNQQAQRDAEAINARFAEKVANYGAKAKALPVKDFDAVAEVVRLDLNLVQQAVIIKAAEDPAKVVYALGRHPARRATIAAITDPVELAAAIARLEGTLKVTTKRRAATEPDRPVRGSGPLSARTDKTLERLEKEAEQKNDRSKVIAYKRQLKAQGRA